MPGSLENLAGIRQGPCIIYLNPNNLWLRRRWIEYRSLSSSLIIYIICATSLTKRLVDQFLFYSVYLLFSECAYIRKYVSRRATPKLCKIILQFFLYKNYNHVIISSLNKSLILNNKFTWKKFNPKLLRWPQILITKNKNHDVDIHQHIGARHPPT